MPYVVVTKALICDDVRVEANGKFILIGVYPWNTISVQNVQLPISFACYIEMNTDMRQSSVGQARVINSFGSVLYGDGFHITLRPEGRNFMFFYNINFVPNTGGEFKFQWQFGAGDWLDITSMLIEDANLRSSLPAN
jgi:hypothetical protein